MPDTNTRFHLAVHLARVLMPGVVALGLMTSCSSRVVNNGGAGEIGKSPFAGVLVISIKGAEYGATIEDPRLERIGDRTFITGIGVGTGHPDEWTTGATVRVPLSEVDHIVEFANVGELKQTEAGKKR